MAKVKSNIKNPIEAGSLLLRHGVNEVAQEALEVALTLGGFKRFVDMGLVEVLDSGSGSPSLESTPQGSTAEKPEGGAPEPTFTTKPKARRRRRRS